MSTNELFVPFAPNSFPKAVVHNYLVSGSLAGLEYLVKFPLWRGASLVHISVQGLNFVQLVFNLVGSKSGGSVCHDSKCNCLEGFMCDNLLYLERCKVIFQRCGHGRVLFYNNGFLGCMC